MIPMLYCINAIGINYNNTPSSWYALGNKQYELVDHRGNVMATVSDRRLQIDVNNALAGLTADPITAQDYYPFGMLMPGRQYIKAFSADEEKQTAEQHRVLPTNDDKNKENP